MSVFLSGHATHPEWRMAMALAGAQIKARAASDGAAPESTLGWCYFTDDYAPHAEAIVGELRTRWPAVEWVGGVGVGVAASGVEYFDEPGLVLMLSALPREHFEVFSGAHPIARIEPFAALVHADPGAPELGDLIREMSARTTSGYLFGGLCSSRSSHVHLANGVWHGGLSGVAFTDKVDLLSRVTQGCQPVGPVHEITAAERNVVLELDGRPALAVMLDDLGLANLDDPRAALPRLHATLVGLSASTEAIVDRGGQFGTDTRVRPMIGLDPARRAVAIGEAVVAGMRLAFCQRDVSAARRDLVRICSEIREELGEAATQPAQGPATPLEAARRIEGAIYISCAGRGGPHFGGPSAELQLVQHALGDVPLAGFFASGEVARHHLYGYTGVLTVFTAAL